MGFFPAYLKPRSSRYHMANSFFSKSSFDCNEKTIYHDEKTNKQTEQKEGTRK